MSRVYLVAFDGPAETREGFTGFLDSRSEIIDWHSSMFNSVFVATDLDAAALRDLLRTSPVRRYVVVEVSPTGFNKNVSGWLPRATWDFIKRRQPAE